MTDVYRILEEAAAAAELDDRAALAALLDRADGLTADDPQLLDHFRTALRARLRPPADEGNLYLRADGDAQIDLFAVLARHLPLLRAAHYANDSLLPFLHGHERATVLALGIGEGRQERDLLARARHLRELTVVGVDIAAGSLAAAESALKAGAADTTVDFHPVTAATEDLDDNFWQTLARLPRPLLVTASFALHHLRDTPDGHDTRAALFHRLRAQDPAAVALCEPDADHHRSPLPARLASARHHYGTLFAAIDTTAATHAEKTAMKRFFGREIHNVIGAGDADRYERHEPPHAWTARLTAAGFRPLTPARPDPLPEPGFTATAHPTHLTLAFKDVPLAAVIVAVPDRPPHPNRRSVRTPPPG
ncbi:hypothetical protein IAG44_41195 [Streptomyces roseirectus]|uniref:Uncharacterized protein n=1 Tax=Streptomyces roseirectus TaxID=2768066 RepID=A0A7H0IQY1_9ACTN|nr:GRAS family protein [Streptomyces roseirectus]QNP75197.1 hypothetical protein IAG44_41195 [Streptomyces roseirectus]